jgi:hypothetical protein
MREGDAMFWKIVCEEQGQAQGADGCPAPADGRFVLHRHHDADGPHLDLRLEQGDCLIGWRIAGVTLEDEPWATEKAPHAVRWLDHDGDAVREDAGRFTWLEQSADRCVVELRGQKGSRQLRLEREWRLPVGAARAIREALVEYGVAAEDASRLIGDGVTARRRAIERLCGLGRELDGSAFAEGTWRKLLAGLTLEEIHAQLAAYEVRFDQKYPPQPVSQSERLEPDSGESRSEAALAIMWDR